MSQIVLDNGKVRIEIEREHGCIVRFLHKSLEIELVGEPRLAENFRLLLPLPSWRGHYILGKEQRLNDVAEHDNACELHWAGLQSSQGHFAIEVTQTIRLKDDDVIFQMEIVNHSSFEIEEVFNFALGGMANSEEREDWKLHWANWAGQGQEWSFYDSFPGSYLGPAEPVWHAMYHGELSMPWVDLYHARARKGVYIGNHDLATRQSMIWAQLIPCTTYRGGVGEQSWPDPALVGETPVGLTLAWNSLPFVRPGIRWSGPPIIFHFHRGIWWTAADYFRAWYNEHWRIDKTGSWLTQEDAWQSTIISYPEGTIGYRFRDLPAMAKDAQKYGIHVLQIDGWHIGGIDRNYPQYSPDPRLGTWDELRQALAGCQGLGVHVLLFSNLQWIDIQTDWYRNELYRYAVRDPYGDIRGGMGWEYNTTLGLRNQTIYRTIIANPSRADFRRVILEQLHNMVLLGASGTQIDRLGAMGEIDYATDNPAPRNAALPAGVEATLQAFYQQAQQANPAFRLAAEIHWDRAVPFVDAAYARFFSRDHMPTFGHTFPEYRQTCCITGNWDYGLVNNSLRFGHIINVEARCLHGTASDAPALSQYVREALRVRRLLRERLWESQVVEATGVEVRGSPELLSTLHRSWEGKKQTLVLNHFATHELTAEITWPETSGRAMLYCPFREPEPVNLPATISIPRDAFVIVALE
jgi:hypothetical protein